MANLSTIIGTQITGGVALNANTFTANGTFTVPPGVTAVKVTVIGGGGGGGGSWAFGCCGSIPGMFGGAGGAAIKWITGLTPSTAITVTVGSGGTAGQSNTAQFGTGTAGGAGGTTSFGAYVSATGGGGGGTANVSGYGTYASGGTGSSGTINYTGVGGYLKNVIAYNSTLGITYYGAASHIAGIAGGNDIQPTYTGTLTYRKYWLGSLPPIYLGGTPNYISDTNNSIYTRNLGTAYGCGGAGADAYITVQPTTGVAGVCLVEW